MYVYQLKKNNNCSGGKKITFIDLKTGKSLC